MTVSLIKRIHYCQALLFVATRVDPAEYCENEVAEDGDLCAEHAEYEEDGYTDQDYWIEREAENDRYDEGDWM